MIGTVSAWGKFITVYRCAKCIPTRPLPYINWSWLSNRSVAHSIAIMGKNPPTIFYSVSAKSSPSIRRPFLRSASWTIQQLSQRWYVLRLHLTVLWSSVVNDKRYGRRGALTFTTHCLLISENRFIWDSPFRCITLHSPDQHVSSLDVAASSTHAHSLPTISDCLYETRNRIDQIRFQVPRNLQSAQFLIWYYWIRDWASVREFRG